MLLIKAYSHDPISGERKFSCQIVPATGNIEIKLHADNLEQIKNELESALMQEKFPVELGYQLNINGQIEKVYCKNLLMTAEAKINSLFGLLEEKVIDEKELVNRISFQELTSLEHSYIKDVGAIEPLVNGTGIFPGAVSGQVIFSIEEFESVKNPIWILEQVTNHETKYFHKAKGLILTKSGVTSHAAILAKNLMLPTILGGGELMDLKNAGMEITIDGNSGKIYSGELPISLKSENAQIERIKTICKNYQPITIFANAETEKDVAKALVNGAEGVGLCRTEHMFLSAERIASIRNILFSETPDPESYSSLLDFQKQDFLEIFKLLSDRKIVIRYLDAPLHEFGGEAEVNPMLGFRGARMLIAKPEIIKIQTRAIYSAIKEVANPPEIILEIPLVVSVKELQIFRNVINETIKEFENVPTPKFAVMLETPRACLLAGEFASEVDYLSFGTNDLTQMTFGFSRDDSSSFLEIYKKLKIIEYDPFVELDASGVGELISIAAKSARRVNPDIHISVCGEQAGNPKSLRFLHEVGVDSISVGPGKVWSSIFRVAHL